MDQPASPPTAESPPDPPSVELPLADEFHTPEPLPLPEPEAVEAKQEPLSLPEPEAVAQATQAPNSKHQTRNTNPYRLLVNVAAIFISLFLFVRVFAMEPFGVPTGSMAPALLGNHREGPCPRCGFPVRVGAPSSGTSASEQYDLVVCPNCGKQFALLDAIDLSGDRLLVDKNVFNLRKPRRWEMAVFFCPDTDPKEYRKPYVKRVVGLPGETISILNGEVYADRDLLRKGLAELRETRILVFDLAYAPDPGGWNHRFLVEPSENDPRLPPASFRESAPASSSVVKRGELSLDAGDNPQAVVSVGYRHWNLDERELQPIPVWNSYDGTRVLGRPLPKPFHKGLPLAHDFSLECNVEVLAGSGEGTFTCHLEDGADGVNAEVSVGPKSTGLAILSRDGKETLATTQGVSLEPGRTYRLEFAFVDRRAILAIDGKTISQADLPAIDKREGVRRPFQFRARGCRVVLRNLKLYRDVYYTQFGHNGTQPPHGEPATLGSTEYFMMGDNSGNSQDSRKWPTPGVPEGEFIGKPFLIHQPLRPARVTFGGRERVFQMVDWSRLRWLH